MKRTCFLLLSCLLLSSCSEETIEFDVEIDQASQKFKKSIDDGRYETGFYNVSDEVIYRRDIDFYDTNSLNLKKKITDYGGFEIEGDIFAEKDYILNLYKYCMFHEESEYDKNINLTKYRKDKTQYVKSKNLYLKTSAIAESDGKKKIVEAEKYPPTNILCKIYFPTCLHNNGKISGVKSTEFIESYCFKDDVFSHTKIGIKNDFMEQHKFYLVDKKIVAATQSRKITDGNSIIFDRSYFVQADLQKINGITYILEYEKDVNYRTLSDNEFSKKSFEIGEPYL